MESSAQKEEKHWFALEDFEPLATRCRQTRRWSRQAGGSNVQKLSTMRVTASWAIDPSIDTSVGVGLD